MDKLYFDKLQVVYDVESVYCKRKEDEDYVSSYSCQWQLDACYETKTEAYLFHIDRKGVLVNHKLVEKLMDRIMLEIGDSLYPMQLRVTPHLLITEILNFEEVAARWREVTDKCRKEHPGEVMEQYIRLASANFSSSGALLRSLYGDTFFNFFFRDFYTPLATPDERETIEWVNFPLREINSVYYCTLAQPEKNLRRLEGIRLAILPGEEGLAAGLLTYGANGLPEGIEARFTALKGQNEYEKRVRICLLKETGQAEDSTYK